VLEDLAILAVSAGRGKQRTPCLVGVLVSEVGPGQQGLRLAASQQRVPDALAKTLAAQFGLQKAGDHLVNIALPQDAHRFRMRRRPAHRHHVSPAGATAAPGSTGCCTATTDRPLPWPSPDCQPVTNAP